MTIKTVMLSAAYKLGVVMMNIVILSVVAPIWQQGSCLINFLIYKQNVIYLNIMIFCQIIVNNLLVKQWCVSNNFIANNDDQKGFPKVFISNGKNGKENTAAKRQRESVCVRGRALQEEEDSITHKIDR
jgi:hypothetical protein